MKFMMIFEGVDRATKVMTKIMSAEKKAATAMKAGSKAAESAANTATRAQDKLSAAVSKVGSVARSAYGAVQRGAAAAARAVVDLHNKTMKLAKTGLGNIQSGAGKVIRGVGVASGIAFALAGSSALAANQLVGTASQFEKFQTVLETTEGSGDKARKAMAWVTDFAAKTPYELNEVMESFVALRAYGLDPTNGLLRDLGDTSAAMNKPLSQAVEAIADAVTGENERLKEFGIRAAVSGEEIAYTYTVNGMKKVVTALKTDPAGIQKALTGIMRERFGGAMAKLSATWEGMVSNMSDIWVQFQLAIMNAGLFDWMKGKLAGVLETVNAMKDSGELDRWAATIGQRIQQVLEATWAFATRLYEVLSKLSEYLQMAADYVGGWENLGMVLAGLAVGPTLISTAAGIVQIAMGITMLSAALMANPIVLIIAAIVAGAAAIYFGWEPIKAFFIDLWASIASGAQRAWSYLTDLLAFDPVAVISSAWSGIKEVVAGAIDAAAAAASAAWEGIKGLFSWTPLEIITRGWSAISAAVTAAIGGVGPAVAAVWEGLKTLFAWHPLPLIIQNWSGISGAVTGAIDGVVSGVTAIWDRLKAIFSWSPIEAIRTAWAGIADAVGGFIDDAAARAGAAWARVKSVFSFTADASANASVTVTDPATIQAAAAATAGLKQDMQAVAAIDTSPAMARLTALDQAAVRIKSTVVSSIMQAQAYLANVSFYDKGAALMDTMAAGMRARAAVVIEEIRKMTQAVRDHLPSSPAKVGPLSDIHRLKFAETIAGSIRPAPMVSAMRKAAAATLAAATISPAVMSGPAMAEPSAAPSTQIARAEVARASLNRQSPAGGISIAFKPTVQLPQGMSGDPVEVEAAVQRALRSSARELVDVVEEELRRRGRREF